MLQRRGNQIGLLVLRVFYFSPEKTPTVFIWVHWQLLKLVGACLGERNDSIDPRVVISVQWLTGARFEAALPCKSQLFHQDGEKLMRSVF